MWRVYRDAPDSPPPFWDEVNPRGPLCPKCAQLLHTWEPLDLGHKTEEEKRRGLPGSRLEHASCNRSSGASRATTQPAGYTPSQQW